MDAGAWMCVSGAGGIGLVLGWCVALSTRACPRRAWIVAVCVHAGVGAGAVALLVLPGMERGDAMWVIGGAVSGWLIGYIAHRVWLEHVQRAGGTGGGGGEGGGGGHPQGDV